MRVKLIEHRISTCNLDFYSIPSVRVRLVANPHPFLLLSLSFFFSSLQCNGPYTRIANFYDLIPYFGRDRPNGMSLALHDHVNVFHCPLDSVGFGLLVSHSLPKVVSFFLI